MNYKWNCKQAWGFHCIPATLPGKKKIGLKELSLDKIKSGSDSERLLMALLRRAILLACQKRLWDAYWWGPAKSRHGCCECSFAAEGGLDLLLPSLLVAKFDVEHWLLFLYLFWSIIQVASITVTGVGCLV